MSKHENIKGIPFSAADEIDRRIANRALVAAGLPKDAGPTANPYRGLLGPELRALAGVPTPPKAAKAPKAAKSVKVAAERVTSPHTALRKQAWDYRAAEYKAGRKVTVAAANAKFGTMSAAAEKAQA